MRASGWREFFEGALPESRVVTPATRHTPTRSLGGAETGRSAMNGNDGPFACAACKLVFEHQNAAAHSKQCKLPVHSRGWCAQSWRTLSTPEDSALAILPPKTGFCMRRLERDSCPFLLILTLLFRFCLLDLILPVPFPRTQPPGRIPHPASVSA